MRTQREIDHLKLYLNLGTFRDFEESIKTYEEFCEKSGVRPRNEENLYEILDTYRGLSDVNNIAILWWERYRTTQQVRNEDPEAWCKPDFNPLLSVYEMLKLEIGDTIRTAGKEDNIDESNTFLVTEEGLAPCNKEGKKSTDNIENGKVLFRIITGKNTYGVLPFVLTKGKYYFYWDKTSNISFEEENGLAPFQKEYEGSLLDEMNIALGNTFNSYNKCLNNKQVRNAIGKVIEKTKEVNERKKEENK